MKPIILWISAGILFVAYQVLDSAYHNSDLSNFLGILGVLDITSDFLLVFVIGGIIGCLFAMVPYKGKNFREKIIITLPLGVSTILIGLVASFSFAIISNQGLHKLSASAYDEIIIPEKTDCSALHEGKFETPHLLIERTGNQQIQINKSTNVEKLYIVEWLSGCEYHLTQPGSSEKLKVKIVSVSESSYDCYVISEPGFGKHPVKQTITISN
jgi:hypothetical protein